MRRLQRLLNIRPGEAGTALPLLGLMLVVWAGSAVGAAGAESLFFARFGPENLPFMFIALGLITFPTTLAVTALLGRGDRARILVALPLVLAVALVGLRGFVLLGSRWVYPVVWLTMMVTWIILGIGTWSLAGMVHDSRQAKRLFPLYAAGMILAGAVGGLATRPLVAWLHAENLLLVWAGSLAGASLLARSIVQTGRRHRRRHAALGRRPPRQGLVESMREGFRYVRRSPLLVSMSVSLLLLAFLYYSLSLPFAEAVTDRFPDADALAGFLGLFAGVVNAVALAVSLVAAKRLFARYGVASMVLTFPVIYVAGFVTLSLAETFAALVAFRFVQLVWMYGIWTSGWQALTGVVPPERREQARTFLDGGPMQAGIVVAGGFLLLAQRLLSMRQLFVFAAAAAVAATVAALRARRTYGGAVLEALRAGWPEVFVSEEEPFGGVAKDRTAAETLAAGTRDPDPNVRRIAVEIATGLPFEEGEALFLGALDDDHPAVRGAAVRGLVRAPSPSALAPRLQPLLADEDLFVRIGAAVAMGGGDRQAVEALRSLAGSVDPTRRAPAVAALGELGVDGDRVAAALGDDDPAVRRSAASALGSFPSDMALRPLLGALGDQDDRVREAAASALSALGPEVTPPLVDLLSDGDRAEGALMALARCQVVDPEPILRYARDQRTRALRYHGLWRAVGAGTGDRVALLAHALRFRAVGHARRALRAHLLLGDRTSMEVALENLDSQDPNQRAGALEILEGAADPDVVRPLVAVWDPEPDPSADGGAAFLALSEDDDPWIRACAALAATALDGADPMGGALARMARDDPDPLVRATAERTLKGADQMETLSTVALMDRVLALRQVPLFRELSPPDLKHVAEVASERLFPDGTVIAEEGDPGNDMHVVITGDVRVLVEDGEEVARRGPGYIVGEMAVLTEQPRMASLVAHGDVRTLSIDRRRFQRIMRERPDAALAVMRELCERLRQAHVRPVEASA